MKIKRASFSFNSSSSSSSIMGLFSDDGNNNNDNHHESFVNHSHVGHQENGYGYGYFEISLPPPPPPPPPSQLITSSNRDDEKEEEFQFCLSFNSSSGLVAPVSTSSFQYPKPPTVVTSNALTYCQNITSVDGSTSSRRIIGRTSSCDYTSSIDHQLFSAYVDLPAAGLDRSQRVIQQHAFDKGHCELIRSRDSASSGGLRKFMVKLRSIKSMIWSSLNAKSRQLLQPVDNKVKKHKKKASVHYPKLMKPFNKRHKKWSLRKLDMQGESSHTTIQINKCTCSPTNNASSQNPSGDKKDVSRSMLNFYAISKMIDVITKNISIITRKSKKSDCKSCPASIKSSPIHDQRGHDQRRNSVYSRDQSIQAAIAHCKNSFGKN